MSKSVDKWTTQTMRIPVRTITLSTKLPDMTLAYATARDI